MEVLILPSAGDVAGVGADIVEQLVRTTAEPVLGVATGSSPLPIYQELARRHREAGLSFRTTRCFLLDEYVGLRPDDPRSCASFLTENFTDLVDLPPGQLQGPRAYAESLATEGRRYEEALRSAGGVDLQLLGIGTDGHIGFNEPGSSLQSRTRVKTLTRQTRLDNARFFASLDEVPHHVVTQGVGTILEARHVLLIAVGSQKATAVSGSLEGPVTAMLPGSALQLHPHVTVLLDPSAAKGLRLAAYYKEVQSLKPPWQAF